MQPPIPEGRAQENVPFFLSFFNVFITLLIFQKLLKAGGNMMQYILHWFLWGLIFPRGLLREVALQPCGRCVVRPSGIETRVNRFVAKNTSQQNIYPSLYILSNWIFSLYNSNPYVVSCILHISSVSSRTAASFIYQRPNITVIFLTKCQERVTALPTLTFAYLKKPLPGRETDFSMAEMINFWACCEAWSSRDEGRGFVRQKVDFIDQRWWILRFHSLI